MKGHRRKRMPISGIAEYSPFLAFCRLYTIPTYFGDVLDVKQLSPPSPNLLIDVEMFVGSKDVKKIQEEKGKQQCL
jgi:hypothetical protein